MLATAATIKAVWAEVLADLSAGHLNQDQLDELLKASDDAWPAPDTRGSQQYTLGRLAEGLLPLVKFLSRSQGQHVGALLPRVVQGLGNVTALWLDEDAAPAQTDALLSELLEHCRTILQLPSVSATDKAALSQQIRDIFIELLRVIKDPDPELSEYWVRSGVHLWLRSVTRGRAFADDALLPLLPPDAGAVLTWLDSNVITRHAAAENGVVAVVLPSALSANAAANGSPAGTAATAVPEGTVMTKDDKVYILIRQLVTTACPAAAAGAAPSAPPPAGLLAHIVQWATSRLGVALQDMLARISSQSSGGVRGSSGGAGVGSSSGYSSIAMRAQAQLAAHVLRHLVNAHGGQEDQLQLHMTRVLELLLSMTETMVEAAGAAAPMDLVSDKLLDMAALMLGQSIGFIAAVARFGEPVSRMVLRLRELLVTVARMGAGAGGGAAGDGADYSTFSDSEAVSLSRSPSLSHASLTLKQRTDAAAAAAGAATTSPGTAADRAYGNLKSQVQARNWDVCAPLNRPHHLHNYHQQHQQRQQQQQQQQRRAAGGVDSLCRTVAEALCEALVASWNAGQHSSVKALLVLPPVTAPAAEQMTHIMTLGRLFVLLHAEPDLGQLLLPIMTDPLTCAASGRTPVDPDVLACLVRTLGSMAVVAALEKSTWVYEQVLELMIRSYREPAAAAASSTTSATQLDEAYAEVFQAIAAGLSGAPTRLRLDLRWRLFTLFSDVGYRVGPKGSRSVSHLGALLPAIAEACEGLPSHSLRLLSSSSSRLSHTELFDLHKSDIAIIKLFRNFWLYCGLYHLANPDLAPVVAANGSIKGDKTKVGGSSKVAAAAPATARPEWVRAAGRIAAVTPMLVAGTDSFRQEDMVTRLRVEVEDKLARAGKAVADHDKLTSALAVLLTSPGQVPPRLQPPQETVMVAFLYAVAAAELCRAGLAPLEAGRTGDDVSPLSTVLLYLQMADPHQREIAWYRMIVERAFKLYVLRLTARPHVGGSSTTSTAPNGAAAGNGVARGSWGSHANTSVSSGSSNGVHSADACAEATATTLMAFLDSRSGAQGEGDRPQVVQVADNLLRQLLLSFPSLYFSEDCLKTLLGMLEREEGDVPLGRMHGVTNVTSGGIVWRWLQSWVLEGALRAPSRMEALLHQFLFKASNDASIAAFRRAPDLLQICGQARLQAPIRSLQESHEGATALTRKLYYSGFVDGMQHSRVEGGAVPAGGALAAEAVLRNAADSLEEAIISRRPPHVIEDRYLAAAALLAQHSTRYGGSSSFDGGGAAGSSGTQRLIKCLCTAPLNAPSTRMMELATFSCNWVTTASPHLRVPLLSELLDAWLWSVDQQMGLFDARPEHAEDGGDINSAESLNAVQRHHHWLSFLLELWTIASQRVDSAQSDTSRLYCRFLHASLQDPDRLSHHPAAAGARFRLLLLALLFAQHQMAAEAAARAVLPAGASYPEPVGTILLHDKILKTALYWFLQPPRFYHGFTRRQAEEQYQAVADFASALARIREWPLLPQLPEGVEAPHPVWDTAQVDAPGAIKLLAFLCAVEEERLCVWAHPITKAEAQAGIHVTAVQWKQYTRTAWQVHPRLAVALLERFPAAVAARAEVEALVAAHADDVVVQSIPEAAMLLAAAKAVAENAPQLAALALWAPAHVAQGLQLMSSAAGRHPAVRGYAVRCLQNTKPEEVVFFLPQLVQMLRSDSDGRVRSYFLSTASRSDLFAHQLIWALRTESEPPKEAFNPEVKRSGWEPPRDSGLWAPAASVCTEVIKGLSPQQAEYWAAEEAYFEQVTNLSGYLYKFEKEERRARLQEALTKFAPPRSDLYIPTNPECRVLSHIPASGACMQSAAKVPILVAFNVSEQRPESPQLQLQRKMACIFKVGDDMRQDVLALQVIKLLKQAFTAAALELYLCPYGCLPTGYECGLMEVVPNSKSRAALGELSDRGLYDIFQNDFGAPGSAGLEQARHNFIVSEAAYAIASFLLQAKDRHNGNILIDSAGHLVHIDFGFILEISPGKNMGFESAAFKLSHEMTQLLDPGGLRNSAQFRLFEELCIRGYLVARTVAEPIIATVALMQESGLPCFGRGQPIANLRKRFHLELTERQAAAFMRSMIMDAYSKWTTGFYDYIQALQNKIPY